MEQDRVGSFALRRALVAIGFAVGVACVAACGGGGSSSSPSAVPRALEKQCIGNPNISAVAGPARPMPIGTCPSPPPQWDILVTNPGNSSVTSYPIGATGNVTPMAVLVGSNTKLSSNYGLWFDGDTGDFFVANAAGASGPSVNRYPMSVMDGGAGGNIAPDQQLIGGLTGLTAPYGATENYAYVVPNQGDEPAYTINVPAAPATPSVVAHLENAGGNVAPLYTIAGSATGLAKAGVGLAVDSSTSVNAGGIYVGSTTPASVLMWLPSKQFPNPTAGQVLNLAPQKTIGGSLTGITNPVGLYVDVNGYLYVVNNAATPKVLVFAPSASGNVAPVNSIGDSSLSTPYGVAVYTDLRVFVTNSGNNSVSVFNNGEGPSSARVQLIMGSATGLNKPASIDTRISR